MRGTPGTSKLKGGSDRYSRVRHLILLNQEPLRKGIAADCTTAMARLKRARAGWHHFERKDKPAFVRWRAREFGALLSRARDVEVQIRDSQALVHEVEMEMRRLFQDPYSAYQRVMFRRADPAAAAEARATSPGERGKAPRKMSEFEKEALFQQWVQKFLGTNPDKMDDEVYSTHFEMFKSHMFRSRPEERRPDRARAAENASPAPGRDCSTPARMSEEEADSIVDVRVKELYRRLVRRLHPDLRGDGSAAVSTLWHEVQEAYAASDVARMELLLGLSDIEANRTEDQSLSQMRAVLAEIQRSSRALEKSLREAESEDAWDFARLGPSADLRSRVERQLKTDLAGRARRLDLLTRMIAEWAQGPIAKRKLGESVR